MCAGVPFQPKTQDPGGFQHPKSRDRGYGIPKLIYAGNGFLCIFGKNSTIKSCCFVAAKKYMKFSVFRKQITFIFTIERNPIEGSI